MLPESRSNKLFRDTGKRNQFTHFSRVKNREPERTVPVELTVAMHTQISKSFCKKDGNHTAKDFESNKKP